MTDNNTKMTFLSGDQNPSWDASLKLAVLAAMGHRAIHEVHTADLFSRGPDDCDSVMMTPEAYKLDGNVTRWTASLEGCTFLGRMPLGPDNLLERGVDFGLVAWSNKTTLEQAYYDLTRCDWLGISTPGDDRVAHGITMKEVSEAFPQLRKALRRDLMSTTEECQAAEAMDKFWNLGDRPNWTEAATQTLARQLEWMEVRDSVDLTTSVKMYSTPSKLFQLFVENYSLARSAYNRAVSFPGEYIGKLSEGELPFYAIVKTGEQLVRVDLDWHRGDDVMSAIRRAEHRHGPVIAVLGKSVPHLVEVWMKGPAILPEKGSAYTPKSVRFARFLQEEMSERIELHPMYRLRFHALDALLDVEASFTLPEYLRESFGTEVITGHKFGERWRDVVQTAKERANALKGRLDQKGASEVIDAMHTQGIIGMTARNEYARLVSYTKNVNSEVGRLFQVMNQAPREERERLRAEAEQQRIKLTHERAPSVFNDAIRGAWAGFEALRAREMAHQLAIVESLPYWNARPFGHWVTAIPGWLDAIKARAELVEDPILNDTSILV